MKVRVKVLGSASSRRPSSSPLNATTAPACDGKGERSGQDEGSHAMFGGARYWPGRQAGALRAARRAEHHLRDRVEHHAPLGLVVQHDVHVGATQDDGEGHAAADQQPARAVGVDAQDEPDVTLAHVLTQGRSVRQGVDVQQGAVRCRYALREPCRGDGVPRALTERREDEHTRAAQRAHRDANAERALLALRGVKPINHVLVRVTL